MYRVLGLSDGSFDSIRGFVLIAREWSFFEVSLWHLVDAVCLENHHSLERHDVNDGHTARF